MKVLITGANGQLGKTLKETAPSNIKLITPTRDELDLSNSEKCIKFIALNKPDWIINCAAYTDVDKAEIEKKIAIQINSESIGAITYALNETGGNLIHISSDYVFNGEINFAYPTNHPISPISSYGLSKAMGEKKILSFKDKKNYFYIIRTSWLISPYRINFLLKMINLHNTKKNISVVSDQIGCPTSTYSLADLCWTIVSKDHNINNLKNPLILHWSDSGIASWYDLSIAIGEIGENLGLIKKQAYVEPIKSENYQTLAKRPKFSLLDCSKSLNSFNINQRHWRKTLFDLMKRIK